MHKQSTNSERIHVETVALLVWRDVHAGYDELAFICNLGVTLLDANAAFSDGLYLGPCQNYAHLKTFLDVEIVERFFIIRNYFSGSFTHLLNNSERASGSSRRLEDEAGMPRKAASIDLESLYLIKREEPYYDLALDEVRRYHADVIAS